jgi:DNA-binding NtrC family response regulator
MILIVDDDRSVTASIGLLLKQAGYATHAVATPGEALSWIEGRGCDLVIQDMNFSRETSGEEGLALLARLRAARPKLPVVLITAWGSIDLAVRGIKAGAADFVTKPWSNPQLLQVVQTALGLAAVPDRGETGPAPTREDLDGRADFGELVGEDRQLLRVLETVARVAGTDASVLVMGESGTGKELVAEAIHRNSPRRRGPFVKVNLGGVSISLFESEMFGHVRGAFTDARHDRKGRFEAAHGGTIFLDEIGDLDPASQVKLLRVLQDRSFEPLGSSQRVTVDVRVVSATNRPLAELVEGGQFREDLLYRINLITLRLPALRDRAGDVPILTARFLQTIAARYRQEPVRVSPDALRFLQQQPWPGNVRQLRQWIERAVLVRDTRTLEVADLRAVADMDPAALERDVLPPVGAMTMDEIERAMIVKSMKHHGGNVSRVSQALGLSRAALYRRLEKYGIPA